MTQQRKLRDAENTWNHMLTGGNIKVTADVFHLASGFTEPRFGLTTL